ncbi:MAG: hypothetical protein EBX37_14010 [Alphaproteobacteria bacterium]|nr:hypothetical protein [Alphaproteobacteria bacterium]
MPKVYFVEGNIGTGKSTFLNMLEIHHSDKYQVIYEPVDVWTSFQDSSGKNILQYFYDNPERFAYVFQNTAFVSRVEKLKEIDPTKEAVFIERSIWSDKNVFAKNCFESKLMTEIEYKLYLKWFAWLEQNFKVEFPYEFVYLKCSPQTSYGRMKKRDRNEEGGVSLEYLKEIHERHEQWVKAISQDKNITVLNAEVDFTKKEIFDDYLSFVLKY